MTDHHHGAALGIGGILSSFLIWVLHNIQAIDSVGQLVLLCISIPAAAIGLYKALRK